MSEPSNGAWPFQEIPEEEGLDISAIFGDSSAAPQGNPFAPPAAAQSVPSSPTPVAQEITPAVAATSQPTTAPIAKAPVEAPAENPIAAAFEQKTAENTKKGLLEKPPVFYHKGVKEEIDDPSMTFEELRIRKSDDFTDLKGILERGILRHPQGGQRPQGDHDHFHEGDDRTLSRISRRPQENEGQRSLLLCKAQGGNENQGKCRL